jgi:hypothetical protein
MGKAISAIVQIIIVIVGGGWAFTLVQAQLTCSLIPSIGRHCTDGRGEIWMLPIFTAAIGIPALLASVVIVGGGRDPKARVIICAC